MSRRDVSMSLDESVEFLNRNSTLVLATVGPTGRVHLAAMWYFVRPDGIGMWTYAASQKAKNLQRNPAATCLVESGSTYPELQGVEVAGDVNLLTQPDEVLSFGHALAARYGPKMSAGGPLDVAQIARGRIGIVVPFTHIVSWDHSKLSSH